MAGEWRELRFSDAVWINPPVRLERGRRYPFVDMASVSPSSRWAYATEEREFSGGGSRFQDGDTLMARITPCLENGKIARFCSGAGAVAGHGSTEFIVIRGRPGITDTDYAYYLTQWHEVRNYAIGHMSGTSGRQRVPTDCFDHLTVPIPPLPEQRAIAHILGTLDDKIELNRKMSETLEAMARALFKSWFVDFEPVRAKMEGRWRRGESLPGLPAHLYDLFPARLVPSELGPIPEGWEVDTFADTVEIIGGGTPKTSVPEYWNGDIPWFSVVDTPATSDVWVLDTEKKITHAGIENSSARILPVGTTIISARGTVGRVALVGVPMAINQSCYGLRGKLGSRGFFNYFATRQLVSVLQQRTHGSVFDTITRDTLAGVQVVVAPAGVVEAFELSIGPFLERIRAGLAESRDLAHLRNTLLPKLVSGELRVKDTERLLQHITEPQEGGSHDQEASIHQL